VKVAVLLIMGCVLAAPVELALAWPTTEYVPVGELAPSL
jgi:hypothetical protein